MLLFLRLKQKDRYLFQLYVPAVFLKSPVGIIPCPGIVFGVKRLIPAELQIVKEHKPFKLSVAFPACGAT
jgi:hypothetical protein